jgi:6,7-dimethyl-8-ribityllumazine synthase
MKIKVCIVLAHYYKDIAADLEKGAKLVLDKYKKFENPVWKNVDNDRVFNMLKEGSHELEYKQRFVPGVFEIPSIIAINIKDFDAFIALGCVIKGETPHFDFISKAAINGIMNLSINHKKPIMNGIITCLNKEQAKERADPKKKDKGGEAARAFIRLWGIDK